MTNKKLLESDHTPKKPSFSLDEQIAQYKKDNPEVDNALRLFNISNDFYEASLNAFQNTKTYVTSSTLMPGENG
jgi:hypothetical protein